MQYPIPRKFPRHCLGRQNLAEPILSEAVRPGNGHVRSCQRQRTGSTGNEPTPARYVDPAITIVPAFFSSPPARIFPGLPIRSRAKIRTIVARAIQVIRLWKRRSDGRRELGRLSKLELRDIGLTEYDVYKETRKPFWRE